MFEQRRVVEGDVNPDDLPDEILQPLLQLGRALMTHARAHRDTNLVEHEDGVLSAWRRVAPLLLQGVLQVATTGLEKTARPLASRCPGCEQRRGVQSQRKRELQSRLGPIRLKRWWHHCWKCGRGWSPPDQALGLAPYQQTSTGLARWEAALVRWGDHVSRSRSTPGRPGWGRGGQRDAANASRAHRHRNGRPAAGGDGGGRTDTRTASRRA